MWSEFTEDDSTRHELERKAHALLSKDRRAGRPFRKPDEVHSVWSVWECLSPFLTVPQDGAKLPGEEVCPQTELENNSWLQWTSLPPIPLSIDWPTSQPGPADNAAHCWSARPHYQPAMPYWQASQCRRKWNVGILMRNRSDEPGEKTIIPFFRYYTLIRVCSIHVDS